MKLDRNQKKRGFVGSAIVRVFARGESMSCDSGSLFLFLGYPPVVVSPLSFVVCSFFKVVEGDN
jgi:hypothetical protein